MNRKATWLLVALSAGIGLLAMLLAFIQPARAAPGDILVDRATGVDQVNCGNGVNPPCYSIKYAVENVAATGDSVLVAAGTYTEPFTMQPGVVILSQSGPEVTIIDGEDDRGPLVMANSADITATARLEGFTVMRGKTGFSISWASPVISNCIVYDNNGSYGGGMGIGGDTAHVQIINSKILSNTATGDGGGILLTSDGSLTIMNSTVVSNTAALWGGGIVAHGANQLIITDTVFEHNLGNYGGAIMVSSCDLDLSDSEFYSNTARAEGGAVYLEGDSAFSLRNNLVEYSEAEGRSGLSLSTPLSGTVISNTLRYNRSTQDIGGSLSVSEGATAVISGNLIISNTVEDHGGAGIYVAGCTTDVEIFNNVIVSNTANFGAGIHVGCASVDVISNTIAYNEANSGDGAGISAADGANALISQNQILSNVSSNGSGGLLLDSAGQITVKDNTIAYNSGTYGTAIEVKNGDGEIYNNEIHHNSSHSGGSGRAVYLWSKAGFTKSVDIHHNWVVDNPGGGFDLMHVSVTLENNIIANPSSVPQITIGDHTPAIVNNTIVGAGASDGVLLLISAGVPTITNNIIASNTYGIRSEGVGTPTTSHNNVWDNTTGNYEGIAPGTTDISCDPDFVDAASDDYHLGICSCAVDAGTNADAPANDYDGNARPVDGDGYGTATVDIGAYERLTVTAPLPKAGFTYTINSLTANFTNTSEHAVSYEWDFGDGVGTSVVTNPSYTYEEPGSYTVTLKALCAYGCSDAYQAIVEAKQHEIYLPLILAANDVVPAPEKTTAPATTAFVLPMGLLTIGGGGLVLIRRPRR
jgi:parallel beta-helix repeat protein